MYSQNWNQYMYDLRQLIEQQDKRIKTLEDQLKYLLSNQNERGNVVIEKIEYKFDQLKVETLSGSLHIGLSPEDLSQIEDVALDQINPQQKMQTLPPFEHQITSELHHWLQQSGPRIIDNLAKAHNRMIDQSHQTLLLQDIQKQFPNRISFYKNQALQSNNYSDEKALQEYVMNQIKGEVENSLANYIKNHKGVMSNDDGNS